MSTAQDGAPAAVSTSAWATVWLDAWSSEAASRRISSSASAPTLRIVGKTRLALGQRTGLVENDGTDAGELFQRPAALDQYPARGGARHAGDDRHRHGEDERAGGGDHHHRQPAHRIAARDPGAAGNGHGHGKKGDGVAVGEADRRGLLTLGLPHQADDPGIGALARRTRDDEVERLAGIGRSAHHRLAIRTPRRQRLAGERRLVEHRHTVGDVAVGRHDFAAADQHPVARHDLLDRRLRKSLRPVAHGALRRPLEERRHLAPGASGGVALEELAAGIHQRDHHAGQRLAEEEGARHRQKGDDVEADFAPPQADDDIEGKRDEDRKRRGRVEDRREAAGTRRRGDEPRRQACRWNRDQGPSEEAFGVFPVEQCGHPKDLMRWRARCLDPGQTGLHAGLTTRPPRPASGSARHRR